MESEDNKAEILQISGGEPTVHPDIFKIIEMAQSKGFKYVMARREKYSLLKSF